MSSGTRDRSTVLGTSCLRGGDSGGGGGGGGGGGVRGRVVPGCSRSIQNMDSIITCM